MCYIRIKRLGIGVCVCLLFFILFSGQTVVASKTSTTQAQSSQIQAGTPNSTSIGDKVWKGIKKIGVLLPIIVAMIAIYRFVVEKRYEIESIVIDLIYEKPSENREFTDFSVLNITKEGRDVARMNDSNSQYLDIFIKFFIPDGRKLLNSIIIKKMVFHMEGYEIVCVPTIKTKTGLKKCVVNKQNKTCRVLLKWETIKEKEERKVLNKPKIFRNPDHVEMYIDWYPRFILSSIVRPLLPKKTIIEFEKIEHENGTPRIGIRSRGIF